MPFNDHPLYIDFSTSISTAVERAFNLYTKKTFAVNRVIYNDPATIILWDDGTKTVVKCHNEPFDKEKGFAMAILKKALGDDFHRVLREYCE